MLNPTLRFLAFIALRQQENVAYFSLLRYLTPLKPESALEKRTTTMAVFGRQVGQMGSRIRPDDVFSTPPLYANRGFRLNARLESSSRIMSTGRSSVPTCSFEPRHNPIIIPNRSNGFVQRDRRRKGLCVGQLRTRANRDKQTLPWGQSNALTTRQPPTGESCRMQSHLLVLHEVKGLLLICYLVVCLVI